jgi:heme exporter protein D
MGGYAAYVWPAFGVTALIMVVLLVASSRSVRARERVLKGLEQGRRQRRRAKNLDEGGASP